MYIADRLAADVSNRIAAESSVRLVANKLWALALPAESMALLWLKPFGV